MGWIRAAVSLTFAVTLILDPAVSVVRKCFSCRSRGPLGDCRDPFYLSTNTTIIESKKSGVETQPCSSGWCRKVIEGRENREGQTREFQCVFEMQGVQFTWPKYLPENLPESPIDFFYCNFLM